MAGHLEKKLKVEVLKQSMYRSEVLWIVADTCFEVFNGFETHELSFKCNY